MADNNDDAVVDNNNDAAVAADDEEETTVETKIERLKSDDPKVKLFSVTFDNFEDLPSEKEQYVFSSKFSCFGAKWQLLIYPGGNSDSSSDGMVSLFLERCSKGNKLAIKFRLAVVYAHNRG